MSCGTLIIRADSTVAMGVGHVMRCLALAQAWQDAGGRCCFVMADAAEALLERLCSEEMEIEAVSVKVGSKQDCAELCKVAAGRDAAWIVVDGYQFDSKYQRAIKEAGFSLLVMDDYGHAGRYYADIILNHNLGASEELYRTCEPNTKLLLGTRFVVLRREFARWQNWKREISTVGRKVLVTMGGSDPENLTCQVIEALAAAQIPELEVVALVGSSNPHFKSLQSAAVRFPQLLRLEYAPADVTKLMAWADVAISAAGSTCWELCMMGLPMMLCEIAVNQNGIGEALGATECAVSFKKCNIAGLGRETQDLMLSQERRTKLSTNARKQIDANGGARVLSELCTPRLHLRPVRDQDCELLWNWVNDPEVRSASFSMKPVLWEEHIDWFRNKIRNPQCNIFIATDSGGTPVGQVRLERPYEGHAKASISIAKEHRDKGYARLILDLCVANAFSDASLSFIHAFIKEGNIRSFKAFRRAGFIPVTETKRALMHLVRTRVPSSLNCEVTKTIVSYV